MSRIHFLTALLAVSMAVGCKAQPASSGAPDPALNRRIEIAVRSQFNIPQDYNLTVGARQPSQISGFDTLPVTLSREGKQTVVNFLLSTDGKTLARLDKFDLTRNPALSIDITGRPVRGNPAARITVINFDDLECPYCTRMHETLFPATLKRYGNQVRFIYKDDPLVEIHPWAMHAAVDANCLGAQSEKAYWNYVDYVHTHGEEINGENRDIAKNFATLDHLARQQAAQNKLDAARLEACTAKQDETQIRASMKEAEALGVEGTPAVFVDGERINGALPQEQVWMVIDRALRAAGINPPVTAPQPVGKAQ